MKILTRTGNVYGSIHTATYSGTIFYKIELNNLIELLKASKANVWIIKSFQELGWDAIDMDKNLYGSKIIDDVLYMCITDGYDIEIGEDLYDPESALEDLSIEEIQPYIQDPTEEIVGKCITEYEIKEPDFNGWAKSLLSDGHTFTELVQDFDEFA